MKSTGVIIPVESTTLESTTCDMYFLSSLFSASLKGKTGGFHEASYLGFSIAC